MTEQELIDLEYAKSLGYSTNVCENYDEMAYEMTHLFNYEEKTKKYIETIYG